MDNRFTPFGGPGFGHPFFRPFPHPFFPRRFLFPSFVFSPFFRDGAEQNDTMLNIKFKQAIQWQE